MQALGFCVDSVEFRLREFGLLHRGSDHREGGFRGLL